MIHTGKEKGRSKTPTSHKVYVQLGGENNSTYSTRDESPQPFKLATAQFARRFGISRYYAATVAELAGYGLGARQ